MIGKNTLKINIETLKKAVQKYLNEEVLRSPVKVLSVEKDSSSYGPEAVHLVEVEQLEPLPAAPAPVGHPVVPDAGTVSA